MKWILTLTYLLSALFVTACTSPEKPQQQVMTIQLETIKEHPLTAQVRALNGMLLQQPFFVQGSFVHGQRLYINFPDITVALPITHQELQRASAETLVQPRWFDIEILTAQQEPIMATTAFSYSLVIRILPVESEMKIHTLTLKLINNRFNTVEAQVSRVISL
ncbi:MAG: penicillin-binding protein activator LpoB [Moritella sp.]|uniref:penicillin-binding protein activator LpoB n=1 Tax=Moritella sp. TaxID=78556 RepID=UPI000C0D6113|nr:penicillin-binding protein activator LpoB [Moritella sp.]MBL1415720.1 penicillin-binding protein activator LpoB [Moritella sp.]PHR86389.1 MAG: penicillin-binding protein activator LpoB [Moritella sp.]